MLHHCKNILSSLHIFVHHCTFCASLHVKTSPDMVPPTTSLLPNDIVWHSMFKSLMLGIKEEGVNNYLCAAQFEFKPGDESLNRKKGIHGEVDKRLETRYRKNSILWVDLSVVLLSIGRVLLTFWSAAIIYWVLRKIFLFHCSLQSLLCTFWCL